MAAERGPAGDADPAEGGRAGGAPRIGALALQQSDPRGRGLVWRQRLGLLLGDGRPLPVRLDGPAVKVGEAAGRPAPRFVLADGAGLGYGLFLLEPRTREMLLREGLAAVGGKLPRATAWLALWDEMLEGRIPPAALVESARRALSSEGEELLVSRILEDLEVAYWRFLAPEERGRAAPELERLLWSRLEAAEATTLKATFFRAYASMALTPEASARLERVWRGDLPVPGLPLSEQDRSQLALELAVREVEEWRDVLETQLAAIRNPDRKARFAFAMPALSTDPAERDAFFARLEDPANRRQEPWVLEALSYLHHPLRARGSIRYIRPSLEMLEEIQRTGDIFFPKSWLDATLSGHASPEAATVVREFLAARPELPERLRGKLLQSADLLFRAAALRG